MKAHEYKLAKDVLFKILETQPGLFGSGVASDTRGKDLALMAWGFIDEFDRQRKKRLEAEGAITT